jgi:glucose/arabinose dehydrogenase
VRFLLLLLFLAAATAQAQSYRSEEHDFRVVKVVEGLEQPWCVAFLPDGRMLVTEKAGRLRVVQNGKLDPAPIAGLPQVTVHGQGGLQDVAPHPDFARNNLIYVSYSGRGDDGYGTELARGRLIGNRLEDVQVLFRQSPKGQRGQHFGGRIVFDRAGYLYLTLGDRGEMPRAQKPDDHAGSVIRLHDDGRVPADNPFVARAGAKPEIWSYGHRNVQGLAIHPDTGELWADEHGPQGGDELNRIEPGKNYGWPVIGFGVNYTTGLAIHSSTHRQGMEQPLKIWVPSIGISGMMFYTGDRFPQWKNNLFIGGMNGQQLSRLTLNGRQVTNEELLVQRMGRIRDIRQGPDGFIYLVSDDRDGKPTPILRVEPVERLGTR